MGVHGLWELLAPVGRRVSVETLAGKTLAVDASIWMVQFMKAMRDEKGEMVRNAHLLGFFRRICKLLFLRTKPAFVFDGGTPALKRRTVIARRRQRENAQAKVRKTAEKLLLNHLKALRLKEVADDIKNQRLQQKSEAKGCKKPDRMDFVDSDPGKSNMKEINEMSSAKLAATEAGNFLQEVVSRSRNQEELDEMLAASISAEENGILAGKEVPSTVPNTSEEKFDTDGEMILPCDNEVDLAVLAALPQSMQLDILAQLKGKKTKAPVEDELLNQCEVNDRGKGKGILFRESDLGGCSSKCDNVISTNDNQDKIDEMLAASIAGEGIAKSMSNASTFFEASAIEEEDGDYDEDEEMILPAMHGEVDPAVLASLPPSMQLDLLVQIRERLIAENRQKYQKVKKDPAKFSELQIEAYLKTVAFRREIDEVQKAAAGRGVGGIQTSRIASEANREYIFSSSFTGDKQELASSRAEKNDDAHRKAQGTHPVENLANIIASAGSNTTSGLVCNEPSESVDERIQTFLDERGQFRVSRSRAMGMRMTRDLQRNLDLMKEIELERTHINKASNIDAILSAENNGPSKSSGTNSVGKLKTMNVDLVGECVQNEQSVFDKDTSIEVSFEYDSKNALIDAEDEIFANLVGGNSGTVFHADGTPAKEHPSNSDSDCDWEEGIVEGKNTFIPGNNKVEWNSSVAEGDNNDESEVEWEEGDCDGDKSTICCPSETGKKPTRGQLEEESNLQEAIRRSLETIGDGELKHLSSVDEHSNADEKKLDSHGDYLDVSGAMNLNDEDAFLKIKNSMAVSSSPREDGSKQNIFHGNVDADGYVNSQTSDFPRDANMMKDNDHMAAEQLLDKHCDDTKVSSDGKNVSKDNPLGSTESSLKGSTENVDIGPKLAAVDNDGSFRGERNIDLVKNAVNTSGDFPAHVDEVRLEEEIRILGQEYINLENEQKKLERNAESVNSELFTECQELLQMFGLPYIIAPMEAEAQCAFLETAKLVDGVITDDSDVLLFGARNVYKNIFDDRKYVETYFMEDIEKELGLSREKLVRMALLLGSDYTEGVSGIGIVNAIEVVNAFPEKDGLLKFRQWVESPDPTILGWLNTKGGSTTRKKGSKETSSDQINSHIKEQEDSLDCDQEIKQTFFEKHRNVSKNWHIPSSFPSETVISAYYSPQVDKSTEPFTWGKPDHLVLRKLCWEKFGWTSQKADELLLPVLKEYNKHETQLRLEAFYSFNERFAKIRSKRIKKAVKGITGKQPSELKDDFNSGKSRRGNHLESEDKNFENLKATKESLESLKKPKVKESRKRKNDGDILGKAMSKRKTIIDGPSSASGMSAVENLQPGTESEKDQSDSNPLISNRSGRGRGRGRSLAVKHGRKKESLIYQSSGTSSSSSDTDDHVDMSKVPQEVRRSSRSRKPVNYSLENPEDEELNESFDTRNQSSLCEDPLEENLSDIPGACGDSATGLSRGKESDMISSAPTRNFPRDDLGSEGQFFTDADETTHPDPGIGDGDITVNADSCDDYLKLGGGFCLDDSDEPSNQNAVDSVTADTEGFLHCSVMMDETDHHKNGSEILFSGTDNARSEMQEGRNAYNVDNEPNDNLPNVSANDQNQMGVSVPENVNHNNGNYNGAFSAMPFLRKRRKK
ncbi:DNA repair protein UVH3 isoform X2 [Arachis hypogaea]|uniref:DNA repair protein UVH3 isoform X2 n=2 Tax=Arachis hypogaea TaxID=3818 RepID=UPI000DED11F0|nr:DNA repair protein UVH3 isoform X2 [Arachis hypogaea]QHO47468.1 DNA repair protein [Arachis hypogaea]